MARRRSRGMFGGLLGKNMMWYAMYGVVGYFAYQWWMGSQQPYIQDTSIPPVVINP